MTWLKTAMLHQVMGVPVWSILVTLVGLPILNEIVARAKGTRAQSLLQAIGNGMKALPLYRVPLYKQAADILATPPVPPLPLPDEAGPINVGGSER